MSEISLKACPFCGGEARLKQYYPYMKRRVVTRIYCQKCRANSGDWGIKDKAIEAWNTRQPVKAASVVHGRWVVKSDEWDFARFDTCSVCGYALGAIGEGKRMNYCLNCGAKMDGKENVNDTKLLKCPFCGGEAKQSTGERILPGGTVQEYDCVLCTKCGAAIEVDEFTDAVAAWNARRPVEAVLERLSELKAIEYNREDEYDPDSEAPDCACIYNDGISAGRFGAFHKAIEIVKEKLN